MSYQSGRIVDIISEINEQYFLPAIQREFVWKPEQTIALIDSILRGYPISSFLFWKIERGNYDNWDIYEFIREFDPRDSRNMLRTNKSGIANMMLVLDGQQRLTSLNIALKGSYTIKKKYAPKKAVRSWEKKLLYIDLFTDINTTERHESMNTELLYRLEFLKPDEVPVPNAESYWFPVGEILTFTSDKLLREFKREKAQANEAMAGEDKRYAFDENIDTLYRAIWSEQIISYYVEMQQDDDRVLDIFARANMGGTELTKSDLLLSMVTAKWGDMNAREDITDFVSELNSKLDKKNNLNKDFVLKTALALVDLPVAYRVQNFSNQNLQIIRQHWDSIKKAIRNTIVLINTFGIDRETLTSANALIPIVYFMYKNPNTDLTGTTPFDKENAHRIQRWFIMVLMNRVFSGQSDNMLTNTRRILQNITEGDNFPVQALNAEITRIGRRADFSGTIEEVLQTEYGDREDFLALSLLYDEKAWGNVSFHRDHIFPKKAFHKSRLRKRGYDDDTIDEMLGYVNRLGNLELLVGRENVGKNDTEFENWLESRDDSFREKHLIPEDDSLLNMDNFVEFVEAREELIRQRLLSLFGENGTEE